MSSEPSTVGCNRILHSKLKDVISQVLTLSRNSTSIEDIEKYFKKFLNDNEYLNLMKIVILDNFLTNRPFVYYDSNALYINYTKYNKSVIMKIDNFHVILSYYDRDNKVNTETYLRGSLSDVVRINILKRKIYSYLFNNYKSIIEYDDIFIDCIKKYFDLSMNISSCFLYTEDLFETIFIGIVSDKNETVLLKLDLSYLDNVDEPELESVQNKV